MGKLKSVASAAALALLLAACGGGGGGGTTPAPTPPTAALTITSGPTASFVENSTAAVYQVVTSGGAAGATIRYELLGPDAAAFIVTASGVLGFRTPPDFERPGSAARTNTYNVTITASDGASSPSQQVTVTVTNTVDIGVEQVSSVGGVHIAPVPGQAGRVFVTQGNGNIYMIDPVTPAQNSLYLSLADTAGLRQVTAVAAAPDFASSGTLYAFVVTASTFEVRKYGRTATGIGDRASEDVILRIPYSNSTSQNLGGWLGFGEDNLLYITTGNGLVAVFPDSTTPTQPSTSLLGKVLRIDPSRDDFPADPTRDYALVRAEPFPGPSFTSEIYANGFRDPRTAGFDGLNLYVADQTNAQVQATTPLYLIRPVDAGQTFGTAQGNVPPVLVASERLSSPGVLVAGPVYRGPAVELVGQLFYRTASGISPNAIDGIYFIPTFLRQGITRNAREGQRFNGAPAVAFGQDQSRNLYYTDGSALFMVQYR